MLDEFAGQVPQPVAQRLGFGVGDVGMVVQTEQPGPGVDVGGDVRREDPAGVDLPGLRRSLNYDLERFMRPIGCGKALFLSEGVATRGMPRSVWACRAASWEIFVLAPARLI